MVCTSTRGVELLPGLAVTSQNRGHNYNLSQDGCQDFFPQGGSYLIKWIAPRSTASYVKDLKKLVH